MSHIVTATYTNSPFMMTDPVFQYNDGAQYLKFSGIELPESYRVDFSNYIDSHDSVSVLGDSDGVVIPTAILANGRSVFAFYVDVDEDATTTTYRVEIPVIKRPEPTDFDPDPTQQSAIGQLMTELSNVKEDIENISGISDDVKTALLQIASKVAYIDGDGQDYYNALYSALYPPAELVSISAVYTQSGTVYTTDSLDSLKADLVVTATYDDSTTATVTSYTLSGTLTEGTSTITVSYGGKTTTFNVTVSPASRLPDGYTEYDYIAQASEVGTAVTANSGILTSIQPHPTDTIELDLRYSNDTITQAQNVFGTRAGNGGTKQLGLFITPSNGKMGYWYGGTDTTVNNFPFTTNTKHKVKIQPVGVSQTYPTNATINVDGTDYDTGSTVASATWSSWFGLFMYAISATSTSTTISNLKNYGLQIGEVIFRNASQVITHDLVPAFDGIKYGFYDLISETFFSNGTLYTGGNWT